MRDLEIDGLTVSNALSVLEAPLQIFLLQFRQRRVPKNYDGPRRIRKTLEDRIGQIGSRNRRHLIDGPFAELFRCTLGNHERRDSRLHQRRKFIPPLVRV